VLDMLKFKCWYYEQAIQDGNEDRIKAMIPDNLPDGIRVEMPLQLRTVTVESPLPPDMEALFS